VTIIVEHLGDLVAKLGNVAAARGAGSVAVVLRLVRDLLTRQVIDQLLALCPAPSRIDSGRSLAAALLISSPSPTFSS
jgi:hypothetical protein